MYLEPACCLVGVPILGLSTSQRSKSVLSPLAAQRMLACSRTSFSSFVEPHASASLRSLSRSLEFEAYFMPASLLYFKSASLSATSKSIPRSSHDAHLLRAASLAHLEALFLESSSTFSKFWDKSAYFISAASRTSEGTFVETATENKSASSKQFVT
ncbi:Uncharacterised protein [Candidatus Anstonella stagnisolia]|nr:Uncharacterised protein [Candidatus Anstonella stagnisolia]